MISKLFKLYFIIHNNKMKFDIVVGTDKKGGIGKNNSVPWHKKLQYNLDIKFFSTLTTKTTLPYLRNIVIMGRNTWNSLPNKYLPNRLNIVITSQPDIIYNSISENIQDKIITSISLENALTKCQEYNNIENIFVIGGSQLYEKALTSKYLRYIYLNIIDEEFDCDTFFPNIKDKRSENQSENNKFDIVSINEYDNITLYKYKQKENTDELNYLNMLREILYSDNERQTRNAITYSLFGKQLSFDLKDKFPLLTTKKVFLRGIFEELIWFLKGQTDSKILENKKVHIWKENTTRDFLDSVELNKYREGDIGNMYGYQWRHAGYEYSGCYEDYTEKDLIKLNIVLIY